MSAELDVSWFDLKKYEFVAELDLNGWYHQIEVRNNIFRCISKGIADDFILDIMSGLQKNPAWGLGYGLADFGWDASPVLSSYPFNTFSVFSTPALYVWMNRDAEESLSLGDILDKCKKYLSDSDDFIHIHSAQDDSVCTPYDFLINQDNQKINEANVTVNLTATDQQILSDFQHWLTEYRKATGYESKKKNFSDKDLSCWHESRLLPYIDLTLSATIEGKKITQSKIASLIFQDNQDIDVVNKLRLSTKPKAEWLLRNETLAAIEAQLSAFKDN